VANGEPDSMITEKLLSFIRANVLPEELKADFDQDTPLLELGVIDSLNAARLLNFISGEIGVSVPTSMIEAGNFRSVRSLSAMVGSLAVPEQAG
jgi:clorobiocin biosynthesis protein CloN5